MISFGWLVLLLAPLQAAQLPPDFSASYRLEKYDMVIARAQLSLNSDNGLATYHLQTRPKGLAALLSDQEIDETSRLSTDTETALPELLDYRYKHRERAGKNQQFSIRPTDRNTREIEGRYGNRDYHIEAGAPLWDRLSVQLALAIQVANSDSLPRQLSYNVIDRGEIDTYRFEYLGESEIEIGSKHYTTLGFKRPHGKRTTYIWLAKQLHYLPVRIEQHKNGELHLRMTLEDIRL